MPNLRRPSRYAAPAHRVSRVKNLAPTPEQQQALVAFADCEPFKISAFAGAGKTSTLEMLAESTPRQGTYLAFNRDIVNAANGRFPKSCPALTTHAMAYRNLPKALLYAGEKKLFGSASIPVVADTLALPPRIEWADKNAATKMGKSKNEAVALDQKALAGLVRQVVNQYLHSADEAIGDEHVNAAMSRYTRLGLATPEVREEVAAQARQWAESLWAKMSDPSDPLPLGHDGYLKVWALGKPRFNADYVLYDEAQDANPVMAEVLNRHAKEKLAQVVCVGDAYQQIYAWRGAVNALDTLPGQVGAQLTTSFRFASGIAGVANGLLKKMGSRSRILGAGSHPSSVYCAPEDADLSHVNTVLCRTNYGVVAALIKADEQGIATALPAQTKSDLERTLLDVMRLQEGMGANSPGLMGFTHWHEVEEMAQEPHGQEFKTLVGLVSRYGAKKLRWLVTAADGGDLINHLFITTAHKAKGCEWNHVLLWQDFQPPFRQEQDAMGNAISMLDMEAARLLYVSVTRAKRKLGIPEWLIG